MKCNTYQHAWTMNQAAALRGESEPLAVLPVTRPNGKSAVSSMATQVRNWPGICLDAGSGAFGPLGRRFAPRCRASVFVAVQVRREQPAVLGGSGRWGPKRQGARAKHAAVLRKCCGPERVTVIGLPARVDGTDGSSSPTYDHVPEQARIAQGDLISTSAPAEMIR